MSLYYNITLRYDHQEIALHSGLVLRECTKHDSLASIVLSDPKFFAFFNYVEVSTFDIASDAFVTFKVFKLWFVIIRMLNFVR